MNILRKNSLKVVWIGMAHVKPMEGNDSLESATGAYVSILAIASNEEEFKCRAGDTLSEYDFNVIEWDDVQVFEARIASSEVDSSLILNAEKLSEECPVYMHTFHAYD